MTEARFWEREGCRCLEVTGHAGYDQSGRDIVCAACSIIVQALAAALEASQPGISASYGMDAGRFWLQCGATGQNTARRDAMFDMAHTAFRLLEGAYPEHVRLIDDLCQDMVQ